MELSPHILSDDEYVAQVRGNLKFTERYGWWFTAFYVALPVLVIWFSYYPVYKMFAHEVQMATMTGKPTWPIIPGFFSGVATGLIFTSVVFIPVIWFIVYSRQNRSDELLVRYYDEVNSSPGENKPKDINHTSA